MDEQFGPSDHGTSMIDSLRFILVLDLIFEIPERSFITCLIFCN